MAEETWKKTPEETKKEQEERKAVKGVTAKVKHSVNSMLFKIGAVVEAEAEIRGLVMEKGGEVNCDLLFKSLTAINGILQDMRKGFGLKSDSKTST